MSAPNPVYLIIMIKSRLIRNDLMQGARASGEQIMFVIQCGLPILHSGPTGLRIPSSLMDAAPLPSAPAADAALAVPHDGTAQPTPAEEDAPQTRARTRAGIQASLVAAPRST